MWTRTFRSGADTPIRFNRDSATNEINAMSFKAAATNGAYEPTLHCPNCNHEIRLTESLAAPLLEQTRRRSWT